MNKRKKIRRKFIKKGKTRKKCIEAKQKKEKRKKLLRVSQVSYGRGSDGSKCRWA